MTPPGAGQPGSRLPGTIGRYRVTGVLGEGGMGMVYSAQQDNPQRMVALKVIRPELVQPDLLRRFARESEVLGRLQHPGIAQIYDAGTFADDHGWHPFFAMELVHGQPLTEYATAHELGLPARLDLFAKVCDAVHYAHRQGVIHRDLKPANILVDLEGQPKILDFGVARLTDADLHATRQTSLGEVIGTLQYMSPEQVNADPDDVDVRSDVYSLGVILYELLSGKLPYDLTRKLIYEAARIVLLDDPVPLSSINRKLGGDIEVIVAKSLEKEKARRYASAEDLVSDVRRLRNDEPIAARPASAMYQLRKFARRNRALVVGLTVAAVLLLAGSAVSLWQAVRATRAERLADLRRSEAVESGRLAEQRRAIADSAFRLADSARTSALREQAAAVTSANRALAEAAKSRAVTEFLTTMLGSSDPSNARGKELSVRELLDRSAAQLQAGEVRHEPSVDATLETTIGRSYFGLGVYDQAEAHLDSAYAIRRRVLGARNLETAMSAVDLAEVLRARGAYPRAQRLLDEAMAVQRARLAPNDDRVTVALGIQAGLQYARGDNAAAEPSYREALRLARSRHNGTGPFVAERLVQLGGFLVYTNRPDSGRHYLEEALRIRTKAFGEMHPAVVDVLISLADAEMTMRRYTAADSVLTVARPIAQQLFGASHPTLANVLLRRGDVLAALQRYEEAESLDREGLAMRTALLGTEHPDVQLARTSLGRALQGEAKYVAADSFFTLALASRRALLGETSPAVASSLGDLGNLAKVQGDWPTVESRYRDAIPIWRAAGIVDEEINALAEVGFALSREKKLDEAEPMLREVLTRRAARYGAGHWLVGDAYEKLASVEFGRGNLAIAESLSVEGLEIRKTVYGRRSPQVGGQLQNLAFMREAQQDTVAAIPHLRESLAVFRDVRPPGDPTVVNVQRWLGVDLCATDGQAEGEALERAALIAFPDSTQPLSSRVQAALGYCLLRQGRFVEAAPLLREAERRLDRRPGVSAAYHSEVVKWLVALYDAMGKSSEAAVWKQRL